MTSFYKGDIPAEAFLVEPEKDAEPIDLTLWDGVVTVLKGSDGEILGTPTATLNDDFVAVQWGAVSPFPGADLYSLTLTLTTTAGKLQRCSPVYIVAQDDDGWHSLDSIRADWNSAPDDDKRLWELLESARAAVEAYAPSYSTHFPPVAYRAAQAMQVRNIWNVAKTDPGSLSTGEDGYRIQPYPLDNFIKQLLRPKRAIGGIA